MRDSHRKRGAREFSLQRDITFVASHDRWVMSTKKGFPLVESHNFQVLKIRKQDKKSSSSSKQEWWWRLRLREQVVEGRK